jgi:hypothetical protein
LIPSLKTDIRSSMNTFNAADRFAFACLYCAYEYRSKFVHQGFRFPDIVKESWGLDSTGTACTTHPERRS